MSVELATYLLLDQMRRSAMTQAKMKEWWDLQLVLLPADHAMPDYRAARRYQTEQDGAVLQTFDVCRNDCVIFRDRDPRFDPDGTHQYADLDACPACNLPRYKTARKRRAHRQFSWMGLNSQLAKRAWHPAWRDAVRLKPTVLCTIVYICAQLCMCVTGATQPGAKHPRQRDVGRVHNAGRRYG
jgi:hypothetical protein